MFRFQRYVSDELTHFVGRSMIDNLDGQYDLLMMILRAGWLTHPPHNPNISGNLTVIMSAPLSRNEMYAPEIVCFCDIPLEDLELHAQKYGRFAVSFKKSFLVEQGANPVFYVARDGHVRKLRPISELMEQLHRAAPQHRPGYADDLHTTVSLGEAFDAGSARYCEHQLAMLRRKIEVGEDRRTWMDVKQFLDFHVFSYMKFFDVCRGDDDPQNYYMEREWRVVGNVHFSLDDLSRVILPRDYAKRFRTDLPDYFGQVTFI